MRNSEVKPSLDGVRERAWVTFSLKKASVFSIVVYRRSELLSQTWVDGLEQESEEAQTANGKCIQQ